MPGRMKERAAYESWRDMMRRCYRESDKDYPLYGGRGIAVEDHWHLFSNFLADMGSRPPNQTLDRVSADGNYCRSNCRWATKKTQLRNKRNTLRAEYLGVTRPVSEWAEIYGVNPERLRGRIRLGWPMDRALREPCSASPQRDQHGT